jgi:hypothetical protein
MIADRQERIAAGQLVATEQAAFAAQSSVQLAEKAASAQLRAYVHVELERGRPPSNGIEDFSVSATVCNFGNTPAHDMQAWSAIRLADFPAPDGTFNFPPSDLVVAKATVPPNGKFYINRACHVGSFVPAVKQKAVYFYGGITYKDVFGKECHTGFRLACVDQHIFSDGAFEVCLEGNEAS